MASLASYSLTVLCYLLKLLLVVLFGVWEIMVVISDSLRMFILKLFEALNSFARIFKWMALLASYCLTVSWCLLKLFLVLLFRVWEIMVVILDNLRMLIPRLFVV